MGVTVHRSSFTTLHHHFIQRRRSNPPEDSTGTPVRPSCDISHREQLLLLMFGVIYWFSFPTLVCRIRRRVFRPSKPRRLRLLRLQRLLVGSESSSVTCFVHHVANHIIHPTDERRRMETGAGVTMAMAIGSGLREVRWYNSEHFIPAPAWRHSPPQNDRTANH